MIIIRYKKAFQNFNANRPIADNSMGDIYGTGLNMSGVGGGSPCVVRSKLDPFEHVRE